MKRLGALEPVVVKKLTLHYASATSNDDDTADWLSSRFARVHVRPLNRDNHLATIDSAEGRHTLILCSGRRAPELLKELLVERIA
jgi:hypothetical protein